MKMIIMGSGTSHGVPVIGCSCKVCKSCDPHDKRYRASAFVESPANIVIDTGPEFRLQALRAGIENPVLIDKYMEGQIIFSVWTILEFSVIQKQKMISIQIIMKLKVKVCQFMLIR